MTPRLAALVRKELIRPDRPQLPGDDGFRFRHLLIRDAAYDALPKATRAELHERFADWLEQHGADLVELDEILGYHLEQAYRYRTELGRARRRDRALAERAAGHLAAAGRRAGDRGDQPRRRQPARARARARHRRPARRAPGCRSTLAAHPRRDEREREALMRTSLAAATALEERGVAALVFLSRRGPGVVGNPETDPTRCGRSPRRRSRCSRSSATSPASPGPIGGSR